MGKGGAGEDNEQEEKPSCCGVICVCKSILFFPLFIVSLVFCVLGLVFSILFFPCRFCGETDQEGQYPCPKQFQLFFWNRLFMMPCNLSKCCFGKKEPTA